MTISSDTRKQVRQRADFTCEYCGITEKDTVGELTIDHFQPKSKGGGDELSNLIYSCLRCNQYKLDYWPSTEQDIPLWNPRQTSATEHFLELDDGTLHPLSQAGEFTIKRLRLNRKPLVTYRLRKKEGKEILRLLVRYREVVELLERLNRQMSSLMDEQQLLLGEQQELLRVILRRRGW